MNPNNNYYLPIKAKGAPYLVATRQNGSNFNKNKSINNPVTMHFGLENRSYKNFEPLDYFLVPYSVVSESLFEVLNSLNIPTIQLIPSIVHGKKQSYDNYWGIHMFQYIRCLDITLCHCEFMRVSIHSIHKLVLDQQALAAIPLEERLIFRLKEKVTIELFHESIVEKIMATNPKGIQFVNIEKYNEYKTHHEYYKSKTMKSNLWKAVDKILWEDWDPIGLKDTKGSNDEYSSYVPSIVKLLEKDKDVQKIAKTLLHHANTNMGLRTQLENHLDTAMKLKTYYEKVSPS